MKTNSQVWRLIAAAFLRRAELDIEKRHRVKLAASGLCLALTRLNSDKAISDEQREQMMVLIREQTRARGSVWLSHTNGPVDSLNRATLALLFAEYEKPVRAPRGLLWFA